MSAEFKKRKVIQNRRRRVSSESESSDEESVVVHNNKRHKKLNLLIQSTSSNKLKTSEPINDSSESDHESVGVSYRSKMDTDMSGPKDMGATATVEIDTELDKDAQAIYERSLQVNKELKGKEDDKVYRGLANYTQYYEKKDTALGNASSGMVRKGPIRAPANLRSTVRWDYQPDICKDYNETGFCGFGDSCKFLHDRSDYKYGWQLETENNQECDSDGDDPSKYEIKEDDDDYLPFKCLICRDSYVNPVMTKCKHYFCEKCALAHYKKSTKCFVCEKQTGGFFDPAKAIIERLNAANTDIIHQCSSDGESG
ncbi:Zinc finger, RING-type,Zinc finger, RING/FYVE/PHD-type,Zinc finger, CCCH-type,Zinc finger [Cinara cedri]|uniref:Zinc finger, RING-type,Zinc finger, RING/FYVE/PHD-type,Zinc finger, CCCH-type,Zinc finger n=1 Tax=Cinara cedri TaxID=506608 RepID=A0A5E4MB20_9HEMI|nr:Zinc finger, RING-type,Zinc finger, RING/FYVE/PHD-type,Zinc finger, CCCH-type,Zinc finger [Cinara cedri]